MRSGARVVACAGVLTLAVTWATAGSAFAQASGTQARDHVRAGLAYAERDKWEDAIREFEVAYELDQQPSTLFDIAQSRFHARRYRGAAEAYRRLLSAPSGLTAAQRKTSSEALAICTARLAHLDVTGIDAGDVLEIDGAPVDARRTIDLDPGAHQVVVVRQGARGAPRSLDVKEGERARLALQDRSSVPPVAPPAANPEPGEGPPPPPSRSAPIAGYVVGGGGLLALGVGAILGITALSERSDLANGCGTTRACAASDVDAARSRMIAADLTLGVGLVATAIGVYLAFIRESPPPSLAAGLRAGAH